MSTAAGVVQAGAEHIPLLTGFFRQTWDVSATDESVARSRAEAAAHNVVTPGEDVPTFLFLDGGRAVGYVTTIPIRLWDGAEERPAHWLKGLMVLPEYRNGPVGFLLLRHALRELGCAMGFVVQPEARKLFTALGFTDVGAMPNRIRVLRPAAVLRSLDIDAISLPMSGMMRTAFDLVRSSRLMTSVAASALHAGMRLRSAGASGRTVSATGFNHDSELQAVWTRMRKMLQAAPARSADMIKRRYLDAPRHPYHAITVKERGEVAGIAFVRAPSANGDPRLRGLRVATLSDLAAPPERTDVILGLLRGAEVHARAHGADALLCSATHDSLLRPLRRRAYMSVPGNVHLLLRDPAGTLSPDLRDWWLMRGDSGADEVF